MHEDVTRSAYVKKMKLQVIQYFKVSVNTKLCFTMALRQQAIEKC